MTDRRMNRGGPEAPTVASPVVAIATVVIAVGVVVISQLSIQWTGDDNAGFPVASGRYVYVFAAGRTVGRGSVTLVR